MTPPRGIGAAFAELSRELGMTADVLINGRTAERVLRRWQFWWLLRYCSEASYHEIAQVCGRSTHSTVVVGIRQFAKRMQTDDNLWAQTMLIAGRVRR